VVCPTRAPHPNFFFGAVRRTGFFCTGISRSFSLLNPRGTITFGFPRHRARPRPLPPWSFFFPPLISLVRGRALISAPSPDLLFPSSHHFAFLFRILSLATGGQDGFLFVWPAGCALLGSANEDLFYLQGPPVGQESQVFFCFQFPTLNTVHRPRQCSGTVFYDSSLSIFFSLVQMTPIVRNTPLTLPFLHFCFPQVLSHPRQFFPMLPHAPAPLPSFSQDRLAFKSPLFPPLLCTYPLSVLTPPF